MTASLHHRGPDACGRFADIVSDRFVFLGHTRLSIIDLSAAGNQPMMSDDGQIVLIFNGEIYNFQELRDRHLKAVLMRSRTDTEVVLKLYEELGLRCLEELNGDFAMAILDRGRGKLFLIRDRAGVKPLYYAESPKGLLFASEIKALFAAGLRPQLDKAGLQRYFVFKYTPGADTLFRGIKRLPPGHYLECNLGSSRSTLRCYWRPEFSKRSKLSYIDAKLHLRHLVEDAVRARLVADVPVGNFLSGGIYSSIIAAVLREERQIAHYCATQSDQSTRQEGTVSDYRYARRLAREWGLSLHPVETGEATVTKEWVHLTAHFADDLIADSAQVPCYMITRGASETSKVFLSGMGADEILLGYPGHQLALRSGYADRIPFGRAALAVLSGLDQGRGMFKAFRRYLYRLGKYRYYPNYRYGIFSLVGDYENSAAVIGGDRSLIIDHLSGYFPQGIDPFEGFKRFEFDNFLQKNLSYVDRMSMANSVEVRVPYLDHRVINFAYSLPRSFKLSSVGKTKRVLVDAFSDVLPRYIVRRRKAGFAMPIRSVLADRRKVENLLNLEGLSEIANFDLKHVGALIHRHAQGLEDNSAIIYALISFQQWHAIYFGGPDYPQQ